ncbi:MAG: glycosyltransferase [Planctomycetes bacterium]|nr:glycosyltransferase [Planctomycetota bacterium]
MKVVFDGICLGDGPITGVGRAFLHGLAAYAAAFGGDLDLLLPPAAEDPRLDGVNAVAAPAGAWSRQRTLPQLLRRLRADVLHSPVAAVPLAAPCPTIATVHDLPWRAADPVERTPLRRRLATWLALRSAAAVLAPSQFTAAAARPLLRDPERLHVVPHGLPPLPAAPRPPRDGPLLVLGDDRPRKNRQRTLAAHALAAARRPDLPPLRFLGPPDAYVDEAEKRRWLLRCTALVQASLFEGFGLPVLEALQAGAPVVCSDLPPLRELAGDAAIYVDPRDPAAIARGLLRVLDPDLRAVLAAAGPARAAAFPAADTAARWRAVHTALHRR